MQGVLSIFDDFEKILDNVISLLKDDGVLYLLGGFNPENVDVLIKAKLSVNRKDNKWEAGWNCFSIKSIEDYIKDKGYCCEWIPFNIEIEIEKNKEDPLRSYTVKNFEGKLVIINGLQLVHNIYLCKVRKNNNNGQIKEMLNE